MDLFLNSLQKEIKWSSETWAGHKFDTIYLGGGTPSILTGQQIKSIISGIKNSFHFAEDIEISLEANPGTIDSEKAAAYAEAGINRVSLGVQSFTENELTFLERIHSTKEIYDSFEILRKTGFNNISLDLISAIPGQSIAVLQDNLQKAIILNPEHLSIYTLIFEDNTPLGELLKQGKVRPVSEDFESQMYLGTIDLLEKRGYHWYEVSNFSKMKRYQSRHNNKYWQSKPYLGLGPSAHSFNGTQRWSNPRSLRHYIDSLNKGQSPATKPENLNLETQMTEFAFLGLRLKEGIEKKRFKNKFNYSFDDIFARFIHRFEDSPWLINDESRVALSAEGLALCDELASYLNVEDLCASS